MSDTLHLTQELISCASITPHDAGCQDILIKRLSALNFNVERLRYGEVDNFWARRGDSKPLFAFIGHTDVVPPGPESAWNSPPFVPTLRNGYLYGRGAADMKGNIAAMITATERFIHRHPKHQGSIAFLITSDEEGPSVDGTVKVIQHLQQRNETIDWCLVGEPSSEHVLGDTVKNGRRGTLSGKLIIHGIQGHIAYPQLAKNPIHEVIPALAKLIASSWDKGNAHFPATSFQISNIHAGTGANNVIPGTLEILFNFRYSTEVTASELQQRVKNILEAEGLHYDLEWAHSGMPFLTPDNGQLLAACQHAVHAITGIHSQPSTLGGTSDGRFIAPTGAEVIELGLCNRTIHQIDECVKVEDLDVLSAIYEKLLEKLFAFAL